MHSEIDLQSGKAEKAGIEFWKSKRTLDSLEISETELRAIPQGGLTPAPCRVVAEQNL